MRTFGTARLDEKKNEWVIDCEPHVVVRLKRVFRKIAKARDLRLRLANTPENCRELMWFSQRYPLEIDPLARLEEGDRAHRQRDEQIARILSGEYQAQAFDLAVPARSYQKLGADLWLSTGQLLCADDVGLGKTATAICGLTDPRTRPALVVTLTHLPRQWAAEIRKFAPGLRVHVVKKGVPYDMGKVWHRGCWLPVPEPDVIVTNYAKLAGWAEALAGKVRSVVFDEIQELRTGMGKNFGSQKYAAATKIAGAAAFRLGLSATPIYNYGGEIWNVLNVLAPHFLGEKGEFDAEWCDGWGSARSVKDPRALGAYMRETGIMLRRTRVEVGRELPPLTKVPHTIDADEEAIEKVGGNAAELARIILRQGETQKGEKLRAAEELSWMLRQATGIAKAPFVADFVRLLIESGEKVVLYGWHRQVYELWGERLKDLNPVFYTGEESVNQKDEAKRAFVDGKTSLLIMSLRSGAGVDGLQGVCRTVVFGELDWSPGVHDQCIGRVHRDGQAEPVVAYFLIADSGSDPVVADVLGVKSAQAEGIRDPMADVIQDGQTDPDRVHRLAEDFLRQRGLR